MSFTSPKRQAAISSFFSQASSSPGTQQRKRPNATIDLTLDSDDEAAAPPSPKRARTTSSFFATRTSHSRSQEAGPSSTQDRPGGLAAQWRFDPVSSSQSVRRGTNERHEKAKRILLGDPSILNRKHSEEEFDQEQDESQAVANASGEMDSGEESDDLFAKMQEMWANSGSRKKRKGKASVRAMPSRKKVEEIGPSGLPYTPLELQIRDLKQRYPGTLLMFEVGYKMIFYGEDASIASKELGVVCFPKRNFLNAWVPPHRKHIYLRKLLSQGYKVGIVEQTETAALKAAGDNRNELFSRDVTHMYTAATYIDEIDSVDELDPTFAPPLMCIVEEPMGGMGHDERVKVGMIVISASTGDVVWDEFEDNHMRTELETRMVHSKPHELLLPEEELSKASEKMIAHFTQISNADWANPDHKIRTERVKHDLSYTEAFSYLTSFYTDKSKSGIASEGYNSGQLMATVSDFSKLAALALAYAAKYLAAFGVEDCLRETKFFSKFTERTHMLLNGNTLTNLEIYRNETDYTTKGSLMWILDQTSTKFGARMLRSWVGRPLVDMRILQERVEAVGEILADETPKLTLLRESLKRLPDLARGLCRIQYGKCTPQELSVLLPALSRIASTFQPINSPQDAPFRSPLLNEIAVALPKLRDPMRYILDNVNLKSAKEGKKESLWTDPDKYPDVDAHTASIQVVESELVDELRKIRRAIRKPALQYTTVAGEEYLVEIRKDENRDIPVSWQLVSSTKTLRRYHTPEVRAKLQERAQYKESQTAEANRAYLSFLQEITQKYYALFRDAVNKLAVADCLLSLARVALQEGYVKPEFVEDDVLELVEGRHPMVEVLRSDPFVPNTVTMGGGQPRNKIITGPNMGGKSSAVRMIALCAIMAQIGSFVPAQSMKLAPLDGILTRMGASDELARGRSTFLVEMQETSDIIQMATARSLVILDELGRGTATFDGMAIANAVLQHLVQNTKCRTLFITHYPHLAVDMERMFPAEVENVYMGYTEDTRIDGTREVTFLYRLTPGVTEESFGVECARLAGLPESVLREASSKSATLRAITEGRMRRNKIRRCLELMETSTTTPSDEMSTRVNELTSIVAQLSRIRIISNT
ncbi:muts domain V-domain-containing protein [Fomitopsis serialis]|uniref:muts domain V-domain-containing protein n=1 Tax=Fomitopsis serialis TaxID=139415 RepID=UPI0020087BAE|nr:muts domain V-domain-containing protein [Neoantrodia serialis]KAH9926110.1 muts domain V-domain-containing protein [Neoantrodia serialis]